MSGSLQPGGGQDALGRLHHPPGDDDHGQPGCAGTGERGERPRPQRVVVPDQRPIEVGGDDLDVAGKVVWKPQGPLTRKATRSASCCLVSDVPNVVGMMFVGYPGGTYEAGGLAIALVVNSSSGTPALLA